MEIKLTIDPVLEPKLDYLWLAHDRPWRMNVGKVISVTRESDLIRVKFSITLSEAMKSGFWDPVNQRVYQEVYDKKGRPVMNGWLSMKDKAVISTALCLRESNDI